MNFFQRFFGHLKTVTKHRWWVCYYCFKAGIPWQGLVHDLSKFSPTEFWESVKYYQGFRSPIDYCKEINGWSKAWMHHKGRNKHHTDYWVDLSAPDKTPIIPYQYVAEMLCDKLAAGMVYKGKDWTKEYELDYWLNERDKTLVNDQVEALITEFLTQVSKDGIDKVLTKKNVKALYKKYCSPERRNEVTREYANKE